MFLAGSTDRWSWTEDAEPTVAFCVDALVHDGLRVPPFDQHPDGDGALREAGLDVPMWREWLMSVLRQWAVLSSVARNLGGNRDQGDLLASARVAGELLRSPGSSVPARPSCSGD
jgi:hypothetical protein